MITQNPIISRAFNPAIARSGKDKKGGIIFVHESPHAIAIVDLAGSTPSSNAAGIIIGACTAHCPPPEGTKILMIPALINANKGKVNVVDTSINHNEMFSESPDEIIIPIIPA